MEKLQQTSASLENQFYQVTEISISYHPAKRVGDRLQVKTSRQSYELFSKQWNPDTIELLEQFKIMLMNRANKVIGILEVSSGGVAGTVVDPKLIFATALKTCASGIILCHNHPSGNLKPSSADIHITKRLKAGGQLLDIDVLDHLIISTEGYYSFADEGMM